jgi:hypothetical protein
MKTAKNVMPECFNRASRPRTGPMDSRLKTAGMTVNVSLLFKIVGAAMPFSFSKRMEHAQDRRKLYLQILKRSLILKGQ